jgi:hypothetical protein
MSPKCPQSKQISVIKNNPSEKFVFAVSASNWEEISAYIVGTDPLKTITSC